MALKADRHEFQTDISFFMNETASRGGVVCHDTTVGSGAAMDQGVNLVVYPTIAATHTPIGILMNDVVNKDLTRTHLNHHKDEVQQGGKVTVLRKGWVVTDKINGTPTVGQVAFLDVGATGGVISAGANADFLGSGIGSLAVGRFLSVKDEDGYAKVEINL